MSTEPFFHWRTAGLASGLLFFLLTVALGIALGFRVGSEEQGVTTSDSALRFVSSPDALDDDQTRRAPGVVLPLAEVSVSAGALPVRARVQVCFPPLPPGLGLSEALVNLRAGWVRTSGDPSGRDVVLERYVLSDFAADVTYRGDLPCIHLPLVVLDAAGLGTKQALILAGRQTNRDWLSSGPLSVVSATAPELAWWEAVLSLGFVVVLGLRLYVWSTTRSQPGLTRLRLFDVFACVIAVFVGWVIAVAFVGKEPDVGLRTFTAMLLAILPMMVFPRWIAGRRHDSPRVALRLVQPKGGFRALGVALAVGLGLGVCAAAALGVLVPGASSHIQDIVSIPGGLLAFGTVWLLGAWYEEFFYRGFVFGAFLDRFGAAAAVLAPAVIQVGFAIPQRVGHLWPVVALFVASVAAGVVRLRADSAASAFALSLGYRVALMVLVYVGWLSEVHL